MTFYTVLQLVDKYALDVSRVSFYVSYHASKMSGTSAELLEGTLVRLEDLFYGMMLPSGNDAAWCIAENVGSLLYLFQQMAYDSKDEKAIEIQKIKDILYDPDQFALEIENIRYPVSYFLAEMNKKGKQLNLQQSYYANPHGLMYKDNKSSAYDVAKLCCYALKMPRFSKVVSTKEHTAKIQNPEEGSVIEKTWTNTNKLLWKGWDGIKTGITDTAGPCLASALTVADYYWNGYKKECSKRQYVVVVLSCKSMDIRWEECEKIINWAHKSNQISSFHD